jgi:2-oxoglutarate dehydrogenase E2 component (dihydrolipoamide succinyltransferase)
MSLENKIEALTAAVIALTAKLESSNVAPAAPVAPAPAPVVQVAPVVAAPAMPAPPAFVAPAPAPAPVAAGGAPFSDGKGLIDYVMASYKALGAAKGAQIQSVLVNLGYQNINDVKPEHYGALFVNVEALK